MEASLYVHIPFCAGGKCDYCDFYSVPVSSNNKQLIADEQLNAFIDTILTEAPRLYKKFPVKKVPTLYIGGGTPSVLGAAGIKRLLKGLLQTIDGVSDRPMEITVEANPESADEAFLAAAREGGATRLSLGVQTFHELSRLAVHRTGPEQGEKLLHKRLALAAQYFPASFSADLLSGLPFQDLKILTADIEALLSHKPAHVSFYALTLEEGTALARKEAEGKLILPSGDEADELWINGRNLLERAGFNQYEVSNFCLPGKESLHNIRYWRMENWLALGPAASGTIIDDEKGRGYRYTIPHDTERWPVKENFHEELDPFTLMEETILMGFRYVKGPDTELFSRRFKKSLEDVIAATLASWREKDLLQEGQDGRIALTNVGLLILNHFLLDAITEMEAK